MRLEQHVLCAFDDYSAGKKESALMHATIAVDASAGKYYGKNKTGKKEYKAFLREYWWLIEPFMGSGMNLEESIWRHLKIDNGHGKFIEKPDFADIIYHVFRCNHAHGREIPFEYGLLPYEDGVSRWKINTVTGEFKMPERVIWTLLAVSVFSKINKDIRTNGDYHLSWGSERLGLGITRFPLVDYWGKESEIKEFLSGFEHIRVKTVL